MDPSQPHKFNGRRRRDEEKRRHVEAAVEGLICRDGLAPDRARALSERIYGLYRNLLALKSFDDQDRHYRQRQSCAERDFAVRTAIASDTNTNVSAYVANATEFAARMTRLEGLERRNLDLGTAIELAKKTTPDDLSPKERRKALLYLAGNVLPGDKTCRQAREVTFLTAVAGLIEQATGHRISFSSAPDTKQPSSGRHHGVEFDVMMAAAEMADYKLSNEAMARRIQRIRAKGPQDSS